MFGSTCEFLIFYKAHFKQWDPWGFSWSSVLEHLITLHEFFQSLLLEDKVRFEGEGNDATFMLEDPDGKPNEVMDNTKHKRFIRRQHA